MVIRRLRPFLTGLLTGFPWRNDGLLKPEFASFTQPRIGLGHSTDFTAKTNFPKNDGSWINDHILDTADEGRRNGRVSRFEKAETFRALAHFVSHSTGRTGLA